MLGHFQKDGIELRYPNTWHAELEEVGDSWTLVLQSPEMAFLLVSLRPDAVDATHLADEALEALRTEYPQLEVQAALGQCAGQLAIGHDLEFITVDTCITCWTRCLEASAGPLLLMGQTSDYDHDRNEGILQAICRSLTLED